MSNRKPIAIDWDKLDWDKPVHVVDWVTGEVLVTHDNAIDGLISASHTDRFDSEHAASNVRIFNESSYPYANRPVIFTQDS